MGAKHVRASLATASFLLKELLRENPWDELTPELYKMLCQKYGLIDPPRYRSFIEEMMMSPPIGVDHHSH